MVSPAKASILGRKRSVDLEKLSDDQADLLAEQIGKKIAAEVNEVAVKCRRLLEIYGLDIKLTHIIHQKGVDPLAELPVVKTILEEARLASVPAQAPEEIAEPAKKKRGRPRKTNPTK